MKTVHLIFNAHIDPVWLWPWSAGLDEILNTCSSVCDLLDRHPDVIFTRGEAWVYAQIETLAPQLFSRIKRHVAQGRWELVGGWFIQPDCNLPGRIGFERQIELGRDYFKSRFGRFPRIAYNVDSFGHAATLPDIMRAYGQSHYVMMRPQEHEMALPARLFRWRGLDGGEVTTFRIAGAYCTSKGITADHIENSLTELPAGINHTMCFVGVGDHGGGPTESMIEWCREHQEQFKGVRLVFSSPGRFFRAIRNQEKSLPIVSGELQHHAIGCYSVHRPVKLSLKNTEELLGRAERALADDKPLRTRYQTDMKQAWEWTCFTAFHDTMGGTCLPSAYRQVDWQIGSAACTADAVLSLRLRRQMLALPPDPKQRIVLANWTDRPFDDFIEHEPWLEWTRWQNNWVLKDERDRVVPHQHIDHEAVREGMTRLLFKLKIPTGGHRILRICQGRPSRASDSSASRLSLRKNHALNARDSQGVIKLPRLILRDDPTDTWSHSVDKFAGRKVDESHWTRLQQIESGPLRCTWLAEGTIGQSSLESEWRFYPRAGFFDLVLRVEWRERHRLLQLVYSPSSTIQNRKDGISGGVLQRPCDGRERPLRDFTHLTLDNGKRAGIACPDVFSISATPAQASLTLLRSCLMAHHDPAPPVKLRARFSDQGWHELRFRIFRESPSLTPNILESAALAVGSPIVGGDLTIGMPLRPERESFVGRV